MNFMRRLLAGVRRQISLVFAIAAYDVDRRSTGSSIGAWESIVNPLQIILFVIGMSVGFGL